MSKPEKPAAGNGNGGCDAAAARSASLVLAVNVARSRAIWCPLTGRLAPTVMVLSTLLAEATIAAQGGAGRIGNVL
jgi:hypothetical protein